MMWTARIVLFSLLLLTAGGWFDAALQKRKYAVLAALAAVLGLSFVPTLRTPTVRLCFAPCAFALMTALLCPTEHPLGAAVAAGLGGMIGWRLCETFPLFFEQGLLIALPTLLLAVLYGREGNAVMLAASAAPFVMLTARAAGDYTLFRSAVLELGDADALTAQAVGLFLLLTASAARRAGLRIAKRKPV